MSPIQSRHEYVWHEKEEMKSNCGQEKPSTVVPFLSFSIGKQKAVSPKRSSVVKAPSCLWYWQELRTPVSIILLAHHSQTVGGDPAVRTKDEMSSGWKRNAFPVV